MRVAECGMLYRVTKTMLAQPRNEERRVVVEVGEIIEFRFFHPINFRTIDDLYLRFPEDEFTKYTTPYAKILENIRFRNRNSL